MKLAFDIFPAATPLTGRLVQLTNNELLSGSGFRVELHGAGSGVIIINRNQPECTAANFANDNFVKVFDLDISTTVPLGGFFLDDKRVQVISMDEEGGEIVQFGGPGALSYFGRQVWWNTNYVNFGNDAQFGPRADGYWWWYQDQYGDILKRAIDEAQDSDRPVAGRCIPALTYGFTSTNDSAGAAWDTFAGDYSIAIGTDYLDMVQRFRDLGLTFQMTGELVLQAFQGFYGTDRHSTSFADNKVLFINVDGTPNPGANIVEELLRESKPSLKLSRVLVKGDTSAPSLMVVRTAGAYGVPREGFIQSDNGHATNVLEDEGDKALQVRADSADVPTFKHLPGQNSLAGLYTPFPPNPLPSLLLPRLYRGTTDLGTSPSRHAEWDLGATSIVELKTTADGSWGEDNTAGMTALQDTCGFRGKYVLTGTVVFTGGSVRAQSRTRARWGIGVGAQDHQSQMVVRLFDSSNTLKATLLAPHTPASLDSQAWANEGDSGPNPPRRNAMFPADSQWTGPYGAPLAGSVTGVSGDYLLVEIGGRFFSGSGAIGHHVEAASNQGSNDLPAGDQSQQSAANTWVEFWSAPGGSSGPGTYWVGDLVTLHTGTTEFADYNYETLRVYAVNWEMDEQGNWWPVPELGGLIQDVQSTSSAPSGLGNSGGGGGVTQATTEPPWVLKRLLTNKSGGSVIHGDVVVVDLSNDESFTTTAVASETRLIGVAQGEIPNNGTGLVAIAGYVEYVNVTASVTRGDYGSTSTTGKKAAGAAARTPGAFCQFLKGGTTPSAILFGPPDPPDIPVVFAWKQPARVATTAAGTLASSFENGDTIDGVVLATGDRILIKDQAAGAENGIYTVNASGAPTRSTDMDASAEVLGAAVVVAEGTANADKIFICTNNAPITLGTTALTFTQISGSGGSVLPPGLPRIVKYKPADESVANTTLQDDDDLFFAIAANEVWLATFYLFATNAANTGDIKINLTVPSGATGRYGWHRPNTGSTDNTTVGQQAFAIGTTMSGGVVQAATISENLIIISVYVTNGATAGNVTLQWAQNTSDGSNATVLKAGSFLVADKPNSQLSSVGANEVHNFPSLEGADDTQPEWWEESAGTATLTEVDIAGEGITETWERCLKLVTTADVYAYDRFTYADEPRLKSGRIVSCRVAVWAVGGVTARVRLQSTVGSLGVATSTTAAWTELTIQGVVLDGTNVELRLEVNNGTAYFRILAFGVGNIAPNELPSRGLRYRHAPTRPSVESLDASTGKAFGDIDVTSSSSPLAAVALLHLYMEEVTAGEVYTYGTRPNGSSLTSGSREVRRGVVSGDNTENASSQFSELLDDGQVFESELIRNSGSGSISACTLHLDGWYEWE